MKKCWRETRLENESPHTLSRDVAAFLNRMDVRPGEAFMLQQHPDAVHLIVYSDKDCEQFKS